MCTPVAGLYLTGSDVASLGIPGAMVGGIAVSNKILGSARTLFRIMASISRVKAKVAAPVCTPDKKRALLVAKTALTPSIWRLEFELEEPIRFVPGQYVSLARRRI